MKASRASRKRRPIASQKVQSRTRSFPCPDDLWAAIERFAHERGLGSPAAAARLLLQSGLELEGSVGADLEAARAWQIEQSWAEAQKIASGDRDFGSWDEIEEAAEQARARIRERTAAKRTTARS